MYRQITRFRKQCDLGLSRHRSISACGMIPNASYRARYAMSTQPISPFSTASKRNSPMLSIDLQKYTEGQLDQTVMIPHVTIPGKSCENRDYGDENCDRILYTIP